MPPALDPTLLTKAAACHRAGRLEEAERLYRRLLEAAPGHAAALHRLGMLAFKRGRAAEAAELIRRALALLTGTGIVEAAEAWNNLAGVLGSLGKPAEATDAAREAVRLRPDFAPAHNNLGVALEQSGDAAAAAEAYREAVRLRPGYAEAHNHLGNALRQLGRIDEAEAEHRQAICLSPGYAQAYNNLAAALLERAGAAEAVACLRRAAALRPGSARADGDRLYALFYLHDLTPAQVLGEHVAWARLHAEALTRSAPPHDNDRSPERRLRVGYVSPDLREHPVARFLEPALARHDRERFEVFCYSDVASPDAVTRRLQGYGHAWRDTRTTSDERLADLVRRDRIDVLVDETGHMAGGRPLLFARRPAPVQVSHNGYVGSTGLSAMDWRLTDAPHDPPGLTERYHTERLARLPHLWCYRPDEDAPDVSPPPAAAHGHVTFGCLNKLAKVTPPVLRLWARVLEAVPRSRLLVAMAGTPLTNGHVPELFERNGLPPGRVDFVPRAATRIEYLRRFGLVDVCLDTFPFNGITTTCDGLWMGVPTVSLVGDTHASRAGLSLLSSVGLGDLVVPAAEAYVQCAARLARDVAALAAARRDLRARVSRSPLRDEKGFTRALEAAYRHMWQRWCRSSDRSPVDFQGPPSWPDNSRGGAART